MSVEFYDRNAEEFVLRTVDVNMTALYSRFLSVVPDGGSILDAGSGSGRDSLAFKRMGYNVEAFDASVSMVAATLRVADVPTHQMSFEECRFERWFDGIWACASLLHVPRSSLAKVLSRLKKGLTSRGVLYASFKYGDSDRMDGARRFTDMNETRLMALLSEVPELRTHDIWRSGDARGDRAEQVWLNCLLQPSE